MNIEDLRECTLSLEEAEGFMVLSGTRYFKKILSGGKLHGRRKTLTFASKL